MNLSPDPFGKLSPQLFNMRIIVRSAITASLIRAPTLSYNIKYTFLTLLNTDMALKVSYS